MIPCLLVSAGGFLLGFGLGGLWAIRAERRESFDRLSSWLRQVNPW